MSAKKTKAVTAAKTPEQIKACQQKIFNVVAPHLLQQGCRSMTADKTRCAYRSQDGLMCAIGVLIPDSMYKPEMDQPGPPARLKAPTYKDMLGTGVPDLFIRYPKIKKYLGGEEMLVFLCSLQRLHDGDMAERWPYSLASFAERHGLSDACLKVK